MRNCIGQKFAILEMKATISKVLRNFEIIAAGEVPNLRAEITLTSVNGIKMILKKRTW